MNRPPSRYQVALDLSKWEAELADTEPDIPATAFQWDALRTAEHDAGVEPDMTPEQCAEWAAEGRVAAVVVAAFFVIGLGWPFGSWLAAGAW